MWRESVWVHIIFSPSLKENIRANVLARYSLDIKHNISIFVDTPWLKRCYKTWCLTNVVWSRKHSPPPSSRGNCVFYWLGGGTFRPALCMQLTHPIYKIIIWALDWKQEKKYIRTCSVMYTNIRLILNSSKIWEKKCWGFKIKICKTEETP